MKSGSKSSNKAESKNLKLKPFYGLISSSLQTSCDLCLQRLGYNLNEKLFFKK